ncbi:bifunctional riboflavin kinase/FAD synthetase [Kineococcus gynurae]|uniref:Riboflavin biosynthesis protein n=1 Tax=Kineococcus gynurae TaxID=452979 RepID=A0ABV5LVJ7_9ACTN
MQRWQGLKAVGDHAGPSVVTIGNFDGVHRGHAAVLQQVVAAARERDCAAIAVTFDPHPLQVLFPDRAPVVIAGLEHRLDLMDQQGLDATLVLEFTPELATWSPERFVREVFVETLRARAVVVGRDIRFGHRNAGDLQTLRDLGSALGFEVLVLDDQGEDDRSEAESGLPRFSSTAVREALATGDVRRAAEILGHPHRVVSTVVHGDHRGRELGYPTANLSTAAAEQAGHVPADGVYAGWLERLDERPGAEGGRRLAAAISVGTNPTFDGLERRVEAYCIDRTGLDLYGEQVAVEFVEMLRPTLRFDGIEALVEQMALDVQRCRELLGLPGAGTPGGA